MEVTKLQKIKSVQFEGDLLIVHSGQQIYKCELKEISDKLPKLRRWNEAISKFRHQVTGFTGLKLMKISLCMVY